MIRDILNGLFMIGMVSASCFVCSSPNIENHYGSFFDNPREIQPAYVGRIIDCEKNEFKTQDCSGPCFSLNVSSSIIDSDFGTSYGCSTGIIPDDVDTDENCFTKTISIRTSPIYTVTATYCMCTENNCNPPIHPVIRRRSKPLKSTGKTVSLEYKCQFPIYIAKSDILSLDPTVYLTMKIGEYCQKSCCSVIQTTLPPTTTTVPTTTPSTSSTPSTVPTTTPTTTTVPTTTVYKTLLEKFNDAMNKDGAFKSLMDVINFNSSASEGLRRFKVYSETKKEVDEHNIMYTLGLSSYKMATNQFSVALDGEIAPLTLSVEGLKPTATIPSVPSSSTNRKKRDTVTTVDWRPYMKPILNQLTCGGCWAFSMIAMVEGYFAIQGYDTSSLSVQQLLTCDTAKDLTYGLANVGCKGGYFQIAGTYMEKTAARDAGDIPFDMTDTSCDSTFFPPVVPTILLFDDGYLSGNFTASQLITMEQNIEDKVRRGPIAVGMAAGPDIYKYSEGVYDGDCGTSINHAVVIVGFTADYWIIRNSWGASWGESGYFRVKRTPGRDPCRFYSYWSQATGIGSNETYVPPRASGGDFVIPTTSPPPIVVSVESTTNSSQNECGEELCEEDCGCEYDDDDEDDYEEDDEDEEEEEEKEEEESSSSTSPSTESTTTSTTSTSTPTSTTTTPSTSSTPKSTMKSSSTASTTSSKPSKTSTTTTKRTTTTPTTTPRRTTTTQRSIFDRWSDNWNNFWG